MNIFLTQFWTVNLLIHKPQPRHIQIVGPTAAIGGVQYKHLVHLCKIIFTDTKLSLVLNPDLFTNYHPYEIDDMVQE